MSSRNSTALASLTATYTDSENEDRDSDNENTSPRTDGSSESIVTTSQQQQIDSPIKSNDISPPIKQEQFLQQQQLQNKSQPLETKKNRKHLRLVSYNDDAVISDEENVSPSYYGISMEISEEDEIEKINNNIIKNSNIKDDNKDMTNSNINNNISLNSVHNEKIAEYGFSLPPEPKGKCPQELLDKVNHFYEKMRTLNMDMNKVIQERKEFRNPSIYEKLIQFCRIDELGTNYSPEIYDPLQWGKESFYEELARIQKVEMDKREKDRKEAAKKEMVAVAVKKAEEEAKKRKSKWDQPAPNVPISSATATTSTNISSTTTTSIITQTIKPVGIIQTSSLTTNITGTKGTIISAFGSLPKKQKL